MITKLDELARAFRALGLAFKEVAYAADGFGEIIVPTREEIERQGWRLRSHEASERCACHVGAPGKRHRSNTRRRCHRARDAI